MKKNIRNILVTGGAGFIGSHLTDRLIREGFSVRVLDNLAPPAHNGAVPPWFNKKAELMKGDVRNKKDWVRALPSIDAVFHLAAYMDFHWDFSAYAATNVMSVALLFEVIRERNFPVKKIIAASSQAVYGEGKYRCPRHGIVYPLPRNELQMRKGDWEMRCPHDHAPLKPLPQKEDDALHPTTPYGVSKRAGEDMLFTLGHLCNIPSVALRYTIVQGSRQSFRHFYSGALRQLAVMAMSGGAMDMHEDAGQMRDYVHIDDAVDAHIAVLKNPKTDFRAFNVGSGRAIRVAELAKLVAMSGEVPFRPRTPGLWRVGAPRHSIADTSRLEKLGWRAQKTIADNVSDYVNWIREYPEAKKYLRDTLKKMKDDALLQGDGFRPSQR